MSPCDMSAFAGGRRVKLNLFAACICYIQGSTLAVFRYPENPRFPDGIPDSPEQ